MAYSLKERMEILEHAKQHGIRAAVVKYGVTNASIILWNKKYNVFQGQSQRKFTDKQKIKILEYVREYGLHKANMKYHVAQTMIRQWNQKFKIYPMYSYTYRPRSKSYSNMQKRQILAYALKHGWTKTSYEYELPIPTLCKWNNIWNIVPVKKVKKFTDEQKAEIVQYACEHSISKAALKYETTATSVRNWTLKFNQNKQK